jgi:hypothetical protein
MDETKYRNTFLAATLCVCIAYLSAFHTSCNANDYSATRQGFSPATITFVVEAALSGYVIESLSSTQLRLCHAPPQSHGEPPDLSLFPWPKYAGLLNKLTYQSPPVLSPLRRLIASLQQQNTWHQSTEEDPLSIPTTS